MDDITVTAGSRAWAMVMAARGEAVSHADVQRPDQPCSLSLIAGATAVPDGWYTIPRIRPGQLVLWTRGKAWGVAEYIRQRADEKSDSRHEVNVSGWITWVETVEPAPRVDIREQVVEARSALEAIDHSSTNERARKLAADALRRMDGGVA